MNTIRSFQNRDLPAMLRVWVSHWSATGPPPRVNSHQLEQAILSGRFFDPETLLIAEDDGGSVLGWCHFVVPADRPATIAALVTLHGADSDVGQSLLAESLDRIAAMGIGRVLAGLVRDDRHGYAGLDPVGHGFGIPMRDSATMMLLHQLGFTSFKEITSMTASTMCYRPPVSRAALQLRRSASTDESSNPPGDLERASGLSHIDVRRHRLVDRLGQPISEVDFWFSDPEAEVLSPAMAILDLDAILGRGELSSEESYLIASVCQSLGSRNIDRVETAVDSELRTLIEQLSKICFEPGETGVLWEKTVETA